MSNPIRAGSTRALRFVAVAAILGACSESPTGSGTPVPSAILVSGGPLSFSALGDTARLTAIVRDQDGREMVGQTVTWNASPGSVASVSPSGLVTSTGNGAATVTAYAGSAEGSVSVSVEQVASRLRFDPDPLTLAEVGDTETVVATIVDANDNPLPSEPVTWTSDDPGTVEISAAGLATARAEGSTTISAEAGGVSGSLAAFVGDEVVVIGSVTPSPMVAGEPATIRGLGFDPSVSGNQVTLDGFDAQVTFASSVELRIVVPEEDCGPPRVGTLTVTARGMDDSETAEVTPGEVVTLGVGGGIYDVSGCVHLAAGSGTERYLIGILSTSETPSSLTPARLASRTGSRLVSPPTTSGRAAGRVVGSDQRGRFGSPTGAPTALAAPVQAAAGPRVDLAAAAASRLDRSGEARVRAAERDWLESLGPLEPLRSGARPTRAPGRAPPTVGQTMAMVVPETCDEGANVTAVVRYVGDAVAFLEDTANPAGGFTEADYQAFDEELASTTLPVITDYFGDFEDVDDNGGLVLVLVTKEVNERENLAGFVWSGDLQGLVGASSCTFSNDAEIFYGLAPDPAGAHGPARTREQLLLNYPPLIAHELTHVLQFTAVFTNPGTPFKTSWELEGGATLAEQLVGFDVFGHGPRQDLGYDEWREGATTSDDVPDWYFDWVVDMAAYFGFKGNDPPALLAPEQCSWIGREEEGNTGPCTNGRAVYGVPSTLLRWVLDLDASPPSAAGDAALMQELTRSPYRGLETLERATGIGRVPLLVDFGATLWADGRPGLGNDWFPSWDVYGIFQNPGVNPNARLRPYTDATATPGLDVSVRAASTAYLEWSAPLAHEPTSLRIRSPADGGALPAHMVLWVLRIQ